MDVKPSNILLTADGQPMLLDFHLAREPIPSGELPADGVGGTPGYMSPEQERRGSGDRFAGRRALPAVDARSDLYSLGRVLAEMLAAEPRPSGRAGRRNPGDSCPRCRRDSRTLIRKCLATDPNDPLSRRGGARRRPEAPHGGPALCGRLEPEPARAMAQVVPPPALRVVPGEDLLVAAVRGRDDRGPDLGGRSSRRAFARAAQALEEGRVLLGSPRLSPGGAGVDARRGLHRGASRRRTAVAGIGRRAPLDRPPGGGRPPPPARRSPALRRIGRQPPRPVGQGVVERHCRALWESRRSLLERPGTPLDPQLEQRLRDDLLDLAVIGSNLRVRLETDPKKAGEAHRAALALLDEAEATVRPEPRPLPRAAGARRRAGSLEHGRRRRPLTPLGYRLERPGNTTPPAASCSPPAISHRPRRPSSKPSPSGPRTSGRISIRACAPSASAATRTPQARSASASRWPPIGPSASTTARLAHAALGHTAEAVARL